MIYRLWWKVGRGRWNVNGSLTTPLFHYSTIQVITLNYSIVVIDNGFSMALIAHCLAIVRFSSLMPTGAPLIS